MSYRIHLAKENFKFAATHFTVFGPNQSEHLHGHNYYVAVDLSVDEIDPQLGMAIDFNQLKPSIRELCAQLDEKVLIPTQSKFIKVTHMGAQVNLEFGKKLYSFPKEDVVLLEMTNLTSESLANHFATKLAQGLKKKLKFKKISVTVQESRGQSVTFSLKTN